MNAVPGMKPTRSTTLFTRFSKAASRATGRPAAFTIAVTLIVVWAVSGFVFDFSDTWQLVINTGTTVVTFLMVFLIQSTQNRDAEAIQVKLDEIIRALRGARNELLDSEEMEEEDLMRLRAHYLRLAEKARRYRSNHSYSLEEFGLSREWIRERLGGLIDSYGLEQEPATRAAHDERQSGAAAKRSAAVGGRT